MRPPRPGAARPQACATPAGADGGQAEAARSAAPAPAGSSSR